MAVRQRVKIIAAVLIAAVGAMSPSPAAGAGTPSCMPVQHGQPRTLFDRVPVVASAQMTTTRDGGAVIAFSSYRGAREFPEPNFSVLALNSLGCVRWRASLRGKFLAQPLEAGGGSIVVASGTISGEPLRIYTLAARTGRVLRADTFRSLNAIGTTLLGDRRGNVAATLAAAGPNGPVTLKLTRRARSTRWSRQVLNRSNIQPPAAAALPTGEMVVGYPRKGRFLVRAGTVAGRLRRPMDAGPVAGNFKSGAVGLDDDGTIAAVWQSGTYGRPWRLRAAVRSVTARRFARFAQLGFAGNARGSYRGDLSPGVHVTADRQVILGFFAPSARGGGVMCATATRDGRFGPARLVVAAGDGHPDLAAMIFGPTGLGTVVTSTPDGTALVTVGAGCDPRGHELLDPGIGTPQQAAIDAQGRTWVLGQPLRLASVETSEPLMLTIAAPAQPQPGETARSPRHPRHSEPAGRCDVAAHALAVDSIRSSVGR